MATAASDNLTQRAYIAHMEALFRILRLSFLLAFASGSIVQAWPIASMASVKVPQVMAFQTGAHGDVMKSMADGGHNADAADVCRVHCVAAVVVLPPVAQSLSVPARTARHALPAAMISGSLVSDPAVPPPKSRS